MRVGLHLPNRQFEPGELPVIVSLGVQDYIDLHHWPFRWTEIKKMQPGCILHVRLDFRGDLTAKQDAAYINDFVKRHPEVDYWIIRNEPQIESKCTPIDWYNYLVLLWELLTPEARARTGPGAVSPGLDFFNWLDETIRATIDRYQLVYAHAYGNPGEVGAVLSEYRKRLVKQRLVVSETNFGAGRQYDLQQWANEWKYVVQRAKENGAETICVFIWEWINPDMHLPTPVNVLGSPMQDAMRKLEMPREMIDGTCPANDGSRPETRGIVLHSTRGGTNDLHTEFLATVRWFFNPATTGSTHAVFGSGEEAYPVAESLMAWHDWQTNRTHLGAEIVQPREGDPINEDAFGRCAKWCAKMCVKYDIPIQWSTDRGICEHRETGPGKAHGKSDIGPPFDRDRFLERVLVEAMALKPKPYLSEQRKRELRLLPEWYLGCIANGEDWTTKDRSEAEKHIRAVGGPWQRLESIGWRDPHK